MALADDLSFVADLARSAGELVLTHYGHTARLTKTHVAATNEAVTIADRAAQRLIVAGLAKRFPRDGVIGEESDTGQSITARIFDPNGRNWVIDPIDGTNNFIAGLGNFAICIGLLDRGAPVLGVVFDVTRNALYAGAAGVGATLNGQPIHATAEPLHDNAMIMVTSNLIDAAGHAPQWAHDLLSQTIWKTRILGSAAIEAAQVAAGVAHAAITVNGKLWDAAAPAAVVLAAGGVVTALDGSPIWPYDLTNYAGAKVPFVAAGPSASAGVRAFLSRQSSASLPTR